MKFKLAFGYYDEKNDRVIPCKLLSVSCGPDTDWCYLPNSERYPNTMGQFHGNIFYPTYKRDENYNAWLINTLYDTDYYLPKSSIERLPNENEINYIFHAQIPHGTKGRFGPYIDDEMKYLKFRLEPLSRNIYLTTRNGHEILITLDENWEKEY